MLSVKCLGSTTVRLRSAALAALRNIPPFMMFRSELVVASARVLYVFSACARGAHRGGRFSGERANTSIRGGRSLGVFASIVPGAGGSEHTPS